MLQKIKGEFQESIKQLAYFQKKVLEDLNILKKYKCFLYFFQSSPLHEKDFKNDKNTHLTVFCLFNLHSSSKQPKIYFISLTHQILMVGYTFF